MKKKLSALYQSSSFSVPALWTTQHGLRYCPCILEALVLCRGGTLFKHQHIFSSDSLPLVSEEHHAHYISFVQDLLQRWKDAPRGPAPCPLPSCPFSFPPSLPFEWKFKLTNAVVMGEEQHERCTLAAARKRLSPFICLSRLPGPQKYGGHGGPCSPNRNLASPDGSTSDTWSQEDRWSGSGHLSLQWPIREKLQEQVPLWAPASLWALWDT